VGALLVWYVGSAPPIGWVLLICSAMEVMTSAE
jgi:hypothetical protein